MEDQGTQSCLILEGHSFHSPLELPPQTLPSTSPTAETKNMSMPA